MRYSSGPRGDIDLLQIDKILEKIGGIEATFDLRTCYFGGLFCWFNLIFCML